MYVNRYSRITDPEEVVSFIKAHPFGILVASRPDRTPVASHIPFYLKEENREFFLLGHLAKGNELVKMLEAKQPVLAIFQGPHAYISPSWYKEPNVPTWNYQSVHVYGLPQLLSDQQLAEHVAEMMDSYEEKLPKGRRYDEFTDEYKERELSGIVGFSVVIENVEAAYKLSQNRTASDFDNIIQELKHTNRPADKDLAEQMEKLKNTRDK